MVRPGGKAFAVGPMMMAPRPPEVAMVALYEVLRAPFGSVVVVIVRGVVTPSVRVAVVDCGGTAESVAWNVRVYVPRAVVVPLMVLFAKVRPDGRSPAVSVDVYGVVPPMIGRGLL